MERLATSIPHCRNIHIGSAGADVIAYKRAVARAGFYPWYKKWDKHYGRRFSHSVQNFQRAHKLKADGIIGLATHHALVASHRQHHPKERVFDAYSVELLVQFCKDFRNPNKRIREKILSAARFWYAHRYSIYYSQFRPFELGKPPFVPHRWDCSAFTTACHFAGGAKNPNIVGGHRLPWTEGQGYTGSLIGSGTRVGSVSRLQAGDMIFYGYTTRSSPAFPYGSPTHVALYDGDGGVYSMGHYPMGHYTYNYRGVNAFVHYNVVP